MMLFLAHIENKHRYIILQNLLRISYAGPLLKKEIEGIDMIIKNKKDPTTCIIGGSKISTKIKVIFNLIKKTNNINNRWSDGK